MLGVDSSSPWWKACRAPGRRTILDAFAATLFGARCEESTFARAILAAANLACSSWRRVSLRGADLRGASFNGADLFGCHFEEARLSGADLDGAFLLGAHGLLPSRLDHDECQARSPALAPLLRLHPQLLHGLSSASRRVAQGCLLGCARPDAEVEALLLDDDWRVALAGIAAAVALGGKPRVLQALWLALERGSWVAPQLAGALSLLDGGFEQRARAFLASDRPLKSLASVAAVLGLNRTTDLSVRGPESQSTARIALRWLERSAPHARR